MSPRIEILVLFHSPQFFFLTIRSCLYLNFISLPDGHYRANCVAFVLSLVRNRWAAAIVANADLQYLCDQAPGR